MKISEVDWERLYNKQLDDPQTVIQHFLEMGVRELCLTLGAKGCYVANEQEQHFVPARKVTVRDTTGAGDAFWSGYLAAKLEGKSLLECALAGRRMAEIKLAHVGPLPDAPIQENIYGGHS